MEEVYKNISYGPGHCGSRRDGPWLGDVPRRRRSPPDGTTIAVTNVIIVVPQNVRHTGVK